MKTKILTSIFALIACVAHAADITFASPPQTTDSSAALAQHQAISLWNLEHNGFTLGALPAGTNIIGKVGIDQTTDGTTNKVFVGNFPGTTNVAIISNPLPAGTNSIGTVQPGTSYTTAVTTLQNAATATGNGTAMDTTGLSSIALQTSGTFSASCTFEATVDGTNWLTVYGYISSGTGGPTPVTGSNATGTIYRISVAGFKQFRARISSYSSGSMTIIAVGIADGSVPGAAVITGNSTSLVDNVGDNAWTAPFSTMNSGVGYGYGAAVYVYKSGTTWAKLRTPDTFKTATATASGDTALWTPTSGKKFRLMRYQIQISADASQSSAGVIDIVLRDSSTGLAAARSVYVPGSAGTAFVPDNGAWVDLGNGILSAAANNVLNINLSATLATGKVRVVCAGTEE